MSDQDQYGQGPQEPMFSPPPDAPMHDAGYVDVPETSWPKVIGIISIVLASLGLACYGCQSVSTIFQPMMVGAMPEEMRPPAPSTMQMAYSIATYCISFLLSLLLLFAGIATLKRKPSGRSLHVLWSVLKVVVSLISFGFAVMLAEEIADQVNAQMQQQSQQTGQPPMFEMTPGMMIIASAVTTAIMLIWPVFLLIWFNRGKVKDEVSTWGSIERDVI
jgi:hypothetical protein